MPRVGTTKQGRVGMFAKHFAVAIGFHLFLCSLASAQQQNQFLCKKILDEDSILEEVLEKLPAFDLEKTLLGSQLSKEQKDLVRKEIAERNASLEPFQIPEDLLLKFQSATETLFRAYLLQIQESSNAHVMTKKYQQSRIKAVEWLNRQMGESLPDLNSQKWFERKELIDSYQRGLTDVFQYIEIHSEAKKEISSQPSLIIKDTIDEDKMVPVYVEHNFVYHDLPKAHKKELEKREAKRHKFGGGLVGWDELYNDLSVDDPSKRGKTKFYLPRGALMTVDGRLLTWSGDNSLRLWTKKFFKRATSIELKGHTDRVTGAITTWDGRFISRSYDGSLGVWKMGEKGEIESYFLKEHGENITGHFLAPNGWLVSWSYHKIIIWEDSPEGIRPKAIIENSAGVENLILAGNKLLGWGLGRELSLWEISSDGTYKYYPLTGHKGNVIGVTITPKGAISWGEDNQLRYWQKVGDFYTSTLLFEEKNIVTALRLLHVYEGALSNYRGFPVFRVGITAGRMLFPEFINLDPQ